jgi:hypothetical protein
MPAFLIPVLWVGVPVFVLGGGYLILRTIH